MKCRWQVVLVGVTALVLLGCQPQEQFSYVDWEPGAGELPQPPPLPERSIDVANRELAEERTPRNLARVGYAHLSVSNFAEALAKFDSCLQDFESQPQCVLGRGLTLYMLQRYPEAITELDRATVLMEEQVVSVFNYYMTAEASRISGDTTEAQRRYEASIELAEALPEALPEVVSMARIGLGMVLGRQGRYEEALAQFELLADSPDEFLRSRAALYSMVAHSMLGNPDAARASREQVIGGTLTTRESETMRRATRILGPRKGPIPQLTPVDQVQPGGEQATAPGNDAAPEPDSRELNTVSYIRVGDWLTGRPHPDFEEAFGSVPY